ncbi:HAMP domain-containing histidine kinase [Paenibacillus sp. IB182496]|uniref:histidine kinase n=1 Tax=Paenibacillus sabuli TaxID=2772509 RepID=A0A927BQV0_9BACL|nr:HAMP domain-containing sensor histidine kinase [Paenibacillus sabuli]MBD2845066.1 HAMP domain-containing histidine kinase [Paenibacillus sabuli]
MRSLYSRVFVTSLYTIAISGFLAFYLANLYYHWELKPYNDAKLSRMAQQIGGFIERYPEAMGDYLQQTAMLGYQLYVRDSAGNDMYFGEAFRRSDLSEAIKQAVLEGDAYHGVADFPSMPFVMGYFENRLRNTVGLPVTAGAERYALFIRHDAHVQFDELRRFFLLMTACAVLLGLPYLLISTRYLVQPIQRLREATQRIAAGRYDLQLPTGRRDEIGQLAVHFEQMSRQLERSDRGKREFVANVSHEIQTPLSAIQGYAEALLEPELDEPTRVQYAAVIGHESRHLAALSRQLLLLSQLEQEGQTVTRRSAALRPQLRQALRQLEWQLRAKELGVRLRVPQEFMLDGDPVLLLQVWTNLLSNAVKHVPSGRSITIEALRGAEGVTVTIADTGDGIPDEELPYLFDRFYRGDKARQRDTGSTGLGLAIVHKIVHLHGGAIRVESRVGEGTTFIVDLPGAGEDAGGA